ncbi:MAG: guanylate kinase [Blastocatellia bacterium]|nr:guanylate kinase [Blastocatellia bacterium]
MSSNPDSPASIRRRGGLIVISAPSGAGKSTLLGRLMNQVDTLEYSISYTTRAPREGEQHGREYFFVSVEEFHRRRERGEFLESAHVHGNFYGTSKHYIEDQLAQGKDIVLDIDVQGATMVSQIMPQSALIFIMPPNFAVLEKRLRSRGLDQAEAIARRLHNAREEVRRFRQFHFVIVNDNLDDATQALISIVHAERSRWRRSEHILRNIVSTFEGGHQ